MVSAGYKSRNFFILMIEPVYIGEIFNSIQGEGIFTGIRQVFIRFQGCPLVCNYCDTPRSRLPVSDVCKVESNSGSEEFHDIANPVGINTVTGIVNKIWSTGTRYLSLTGGEPLVHADFIDGLSREIDSPLYLETSGCLPDNARELQYVIDVAACDIKLPEHNAASDYLSLLKAELETVRIFYEAGAVTFVKIAITEKTSDNALKTIVESLSGLDDTIPLVVQPVTPGHGAVPPDHMRLLELIDLAGGYLMDVRAIPQVHRMMRLL
jgi:7-carboxy-7-deazaguanine synthase